MKVKILTGVGRLSEFEENINDFIKDKKIIDIKFTEVYNDQGDGGYTAYVLYE